MHTYRFLQRNLGHWDAIGAAAGYGPHFPEKFTTLITVRLSIV